MTAIVVLGMHRSGTSCLAGMLAAGGLASAGDAIRNWDNARGHHEMLDVVRLSEAVLAHSGGHYLAPPASLRWTDDHAAARDRILRTPNAGRPPLLKDPRMLLALAFWRASAIPFHVVGIVRHPLAVARSLESWRELPLAEGVALWTAHNRALLDDRDRHGYAVVDFAAPAAALIASVVAASQAFGVPFDAAALAAAYDETLVHHDDDGTAIDEGALALYRELAAPAAASRPAFPHAAVAAVREAGDLAAARAALAAIPDAAAVLVPIVTALIRRRAYAEARTLITEARLAEGVGDLLRGKVALAAGDAALAVVHLERATAVDAPYFQAHQLLAQARRAAGDREGARIAIERVVTEALYPHGPLATLAEWHQLDREPAAARAAMARAIAAAPGHRRGRLRTRLAEWLIADGDVAAARTELAAAIAEDPGYPRSRDVLARLRD